MYTKSYSGNSNGRTYHIPVLGILGATAVLTTSIAIGGHQFMRGRAYDAAFETARSAPVVELQLPRPMTAEEIAEDIYGAKDGSIAAHAIEDTVLRINASRLERLANMEVGNDGTPIFGAGKIALPDVKVRP